MAATTRPATTIARYVDISPASPSVGHVRAARMISDRRCVGHEQPRSGHRVACEERRAVEADTDGWWLFARESRHRDEARLGLTSDGGSKRTELTSRLPLIGQLQFAGARGDGDRAAIRVQNAAVAKATGMLGKLRSFPYTVDTARPGLAFDDGAHLSIVAVGEIWAPAWTDVVDGLPRSASSDIGLVEAAVMAVRWFIWRVILNDQDKRWRVLVHRTSRRSRR